MSTVVEAPPQESLPARMRRQVGKSLTKGFFLAGAHGARVLPVSIPAVHGVEVQRDLAYGPRPEHRLDLYRPKKVSGRLPTVVYVHGGAFHFMSKGTHWMFALMYARAGYQVLTLDYRLAPEHRYPAAVEDLCQFIVWLRDNADTHRVDLERLALAGESAGGNLATALTLALTTRRDEHFARAAFDTGVVPKVALPACAVLQVSDPGHIPVSGFASTFFMDRFEEMATAYLPTTPLPLGHRALDLVDIIVALERGEPTDRPLPKFFAPSGAADPLKHDAARLETVLRARGVHVEAPVYEGGMHAFHAFVFNAKARRCWRDKYAFLAQHL